MEKNKIQPDKNRQPEPIDTLDTETTFANMNVEGMPWYEADQQGKGGKSDIPSLSKSEQRAMIRGALLAALPFLGGAVLVLAVLYGLAYLWLS